ncbi:hypothetical protein SHI21_07210 [Bacteriovorax sp. PP10]|uniref:Uncharacterized protein n=1 Tax=Bacteriovorax antarcticus TaxID=3088717 RepID=A0ABU5VSK4_9BACT|nr:hypothetical protein [Bacteriovorax sp. PP10]MEA9355981.1 hypothetical protein [Bacteriovorax sp. PP10]
MKLILILLGRFLNPYQSIAGEGEAKEYYQLNFDLFPWSITFWGDELNLSITPS